MSRSLDESASEILVPEGPLYSPFFSPDGESVGFFDRTRPLVLKSVPSAGGSISTICELESDLRGATWGDDGPTSSSVSSGHSRDSGGYRLREVSRNN